MNLSLQRFVLQPWLDSLAFQIQLRNEQYQSAPAMFCS
jgi:hypothetical protein